MFTAESRLRGGALAAIGLSIGLVTLVFEQDGNLFNTSAQTLALAQKNAGPQMAMALVPQGAQPGGVGGPYVGLGGNGNRPGGASARAAAPVGSAGNGNPAGTPVNANALAQPGVPGIGDGQGAGGAPGAGAPDDSGGTGNGGGGGSGGGPDILTPGSGINGPGTTVLPTPAAPVPEPLTWMTMILGFGIIGGALRMARTRDARTDGTSGAIRRTA